MGPEDIEDAVNSYVAKNQFESSSRQLLSDVYPGVPGRESHGFLDSHLNNLKSSLIVIDEESNSFFL